MREETEITLRLYWEITKNGESSRENLLNLEIKAEIPAKLRCQCGWRWQPLQEHGLNVRNMLSSRIDLFIIIFTKITKSVCSFYVSITKY